MTQAHEGDERNHAPEVWAQFGNPYRPTTIVLDARGEVAVRVDGPIVYATLNAELERLV